MAQNADVSEQNLLHQSLRDLTRRTGCTVAFGGLTATDGTPLTAFVGAHGSSLNGLLIEPAHGVGGLAMSSRALVSAVHYGTADTITHHYDRQVAAEGIVSLMAVPVLVDGRVRAVLYGGHRVETHVGTAAVRETMKISRALEWQFSVAAEVDRRLALIETDGAVASSSHPASHPAAPSSADSSAQSRERLELRELYAEVRELARAVVDPDISRRLDAVGRALMPVSEAATSARPQLSPRELDMLAQIALGKRNAQIADQLGLTEMTVKSYVSSAMRKLGSASRYGAVIAARRAGLIP